ncbi:hypothetical protein, partial [Actinokineospora alba]|uniref:hypothetical protein n=1 Tax=Actinokineospora alba TaxID=504798 RepID=UPI001E5AC643
GWAGPVWPGGSGVGCRVWLGGSGVAGWVWRGVSGVAGRIWLAGPVAGVAVGTAWSRPARGRWHSPARR